ncbi:MAG: DUF2007 domain-containing protein [SAR202 cluster bacterium]|nr:DUF2007 domain-containing protein [SAR202 cluster bacterium]
MKWVSLATAPDQLVAEMWRELLNGEGVSAMVRPGDTSSFLGVSGYPCRVMVREHQLETGKELLEGHLGHEVE